MNLSGYGLIVLGFGLFQVVYLVCQCLAGKLIGVQPTRAIYGMGPLLFQFQFGGFEIVVKLLPFTAAVEFGASDDPNGLIFMPWHKKVLLAAFGLLGCFALLALVLGAQTWPRVAATWPEVWAVFTQWWMPLRLAEATAALARDNGILTAVAIVGAKVLGYNTLPIAFFNGGQVVLGLGQAVVGQTAIERVLPSLYKLGFVFVGLFLLLLITRHFIA